MLTDSIAYDRPQPEPTNLSQGITKNN